jgi:hypothetical protein
MEQRLDATYLCSGSFQRAAAIGTVAVAIGTGILLAAWGISFLWRYTPPEIRLANPEVTVTQSEPLLIRQDSPFSIEQPRSIKIVPADVPAGATVVGGDTRTGAGDVLKREVTVFWQVTHQPGHVVTGWNYPDGHDGVPVREYCYYEAQNIDGSSTSINLAKDRIPNIVAAPVPDLAGAIAKCQWSRGSE